MAFLPETPDENKDQNGQQNQNVPLIPTLAGSGGPSGATQGSGGSQATTNTATPGAAPSAPWANIGSYLSTNQPQSKQVANTIAGNFGQTYNDIQNQGNQATQAFNKSVGDNTVGLDQNLLNSAKANPAQFAKDPQNVAAFQKSFNANYGGPSSFDATPDYAALQGAINTAQTNAKLVGQGTTGIQTLLQNTGKNSTPGQNALDTLLLQENPDNFKTINEAAKPFGGLSDYLSGKTSDLNAAAKSAQATTGATQNAFQNAFVGQGGVLPTFQNDFNARLASAKNQATQNAQQYQTDIVGGNPTIGQQEASALGLDTGQWGLTLRDINSLQNDYGDKFDLSKYVNAQNADAAINPENFASKDDYAEASALAQLTGNPNFLNGDPTKAGTYKSNLVNFDQNNAGLDAAKLLGDRDTEALGKYAVGYNGPDQKITDMLKDLYQRNGSILNNNQQMWLNEKLGNPINTPVKPPAPPTTPTAPPQNGDTRMNPTSGSMEYFNGSQWIAAPSEFRNFQNGGYTERFNYQTGQYEPVTSTGTSSGGLGAGVYGFRTGVGGAM